MSTADKLRAAKALIENPAHWCQGTYAKDAAGYDIQISKFKQPAVAWCTEGALFKVGAYAAEDSPLVNDCMYHAAQQMGYRDQVNLNDTADHPTVMKMFDRAIKLASAEEAR